MTQPISPMLFVGIFLLIVIAAVLMLSTVINRHQADGTGNASTPKEAIARQLGLLKEGDAERLKTTFTPRWRDAITTQAVRQGQQSYADMTVDELVGQVAYVDGDGPRGQARVSVPAGTTLTTLLLIDGEWLADSVWFR